MKELIKILTKQEREIIAGRLRDHKCLNYVEFYEAITGKEIPGYTSRVEDIAVMSRAILDLCDTSNMIELPRGKDGEVIHVGDTVYNEAGDILEVIGIEYSYCDRVYINAYYVGTENKNLFFPNELTHKNTATIAETTEAFNEAVKVTAQYVEKSMNACVEAMKKLAEVFNRLGDNNG